MDRTESYFKPFFQPRHSDPNLRVARLIDRRTGTWDPGALADCFHPIDADRISAIGLPEEQEEDYYLDAKQ